MAATISSIICTFDRPEFVSRAVESLVKQSLDSTQYEIVVVDNGNGDATEKLIRNRTSGNPEIRYFRLHEQGLSNARNAAIQYARGSILAFLDDDAVACPDWLNAILRAFREVDPSPGLVCGPVEPEWGAPRPDWLQDEFLGVYSVLDWSRTPRPLTEAEWIVGANFAVRRDVMQACGLFDTRVGRRGHSLLSGEETVLTRRIRAAGYAIYYDPAVSVKHYIHQDRLRKGWFFRRLFWGAASRGLLDRDDSRGFVDSWKYVYAAAKNAVRQTFRSSRSLPVASRRFRRSRAVIRELGLVYGFLFLRQNSG